MVFPSSVTNERCTTLSIVVNFRSFEGSLVVFDCGCCGVCIVAGDDHLPGIRSDCKQLCFLEHHDNHYLVLCLFD
jgi:hypothetical protein